MKHKILVLNGPNLNLLGKREPQIYGLDTLEDINKSLLEVANNSNIVLEFHQSNSESALITKTQSYFENNYDFLIINPAAFTHTSIALRDAIIAVNVPFIEIHLSNIFKREPFRHKSYFSDIAIGTISGFGVKGYHMALTYAIDYLSRKE